MFNKYEECIQDGSLVFLYSSPRQIYTVTVTKGGHFAHTRGNFLFDSIIGKPYGTRMSSHNNRGHLIALHPDCERWTKALPHRTQIIYTADISLILDQLNLSDGSRVVESGTGSGSLTHSLARQVSPSGHVFTFEYHQDRREKARREFELHRLSDVVTSSHKNVYLDGFSFTSGPQDQLENSANNDGNGVECIDGTVDAVFLDLPEPWKAVPHTSRLFNPEKLGRICSFSPCIEQVQKTRAALVTAGYTDIVMFELLQKSWESRDISIKPLPLVQTLITNNDEVVLQNDESSMNQESTPVETNQSKKRRITQISNSGDSASMRVASCPQMEIKGHTAYLTFASYLPANYVN